MYTGNMLLIHSPSLNEKVSYWYWRQAYKFSDFKSLGHSPYHSGFLCVGFNFLHNSYQVEIRGLREQLDVGTTTVNSSLEVHFIPEEKINITHIRDRKHRNILLQNCKTSV